MADENAGSVPGPAPAQPVPAMEPAAEPKKPDAAATGHVIATIKDPFDETAFKRALYEHLEALAAKHGADKYTVVYLMDVHDDISSWHSNLIYKATASARKSKDILLVIYSPGGQIEPAYLISKTCKRLAHTKFIAAIPRKAKSAATLIALGADEIHMGLMSELGPVDPQIGGLPALGVRNALEIVAQLTGKYPNTSQMFADYLKDKLDLRILGFFERMNESAMQYAERLLAGKSLPEEWTPRSLGDHFVNHYKDHSFVIDFDEAKTLLGESMVKHESSEYTFANAVYESFDLIRIFLDLAVDGRDLDIVGGGIGAFRVFKRERNK